MEYDTLMMSREQHQQQVNRLAQSYTDAQADSQWLKMILDNGVERLSGLVDALRTQSQQRSSHTYDGGSELAPVILDDRRGGSW